MNVQRDERMTTIFQVLEVADMRIALAGFLDPFSIIRLSATCHRLRSALYTASSKRWNIGRWDIDVHLKRFVEDPKSFRRMLGKCSAIVSGSNALQFLDGTCYEASDMDVFFDDLEGLVAFGDYLMGGECYLYDPDLEQRQSPDWTTMRSMLTVVPYLAERDYYGQSQSFNSSLEVVCLSHALFGRTIQLIWSAMGAFQMLVKFDSTLVMNFFTWNASYALFPWLTFNQRCGIMTGKRDVQSKRDKKYLGRGFRMERMFLNHPQIWKSVENHDDRPPRTLGDPYTWCLPFDIGGIDKPVVVDTVPLSKPILVSTFGPVNGSTVGR